MKSTSFVTHLVKYMRYQGVYGVQLEIRIPPTLKISSPIEWKWEWESLDYQKAWLCFLAFGYVLVWVVKSKVNFF